MTDKVVFAVTGKDGNFDVHLYPDQTQEELQKEFDAGGSHEREEIVIYKAVKGNSLAALQLLMGNNDELQDDVEKLVKEAIVAGIGFGKKLAQDEIMRRLFG